jgi:hypothetical protein
VPYDPEPDVAVVDRPETLDQRYFDRFHLVAEILSESDKRIIEGKRDIYRAQQVCTCIVLVRQDRIEVPLTCAPVTAGPPGCSAAPTRWTCRAFAYLPGPRDLRGDAARLRPANEPPRAPRPIHSRFGCNLKRCVQF